MTNKPDKGHKDGSCNRTACQASLAGRVQGWMVNHTVQDGRFYYCASCCHKFNEWDDKIREPRRITWDETTGRETMFHAVLFGDGTDKKGGFEGLAEAGIVPAKTYSPVPGITYHFTEHRQSLARNFDLKLRKGEAHGLYGKVNRKKRLF